MFNHWYLFPEVIAMVPWTWEIMYFSWLAVSNKLLLTLLDVENWLQLLSDEWMYIYPSNHWFQHIYSNSINMKQPTHCYFLVIADCWLEEWLLITVVWFVVWGAIMFWINIYIVNLWWLVLYFGSSCAMWEFFSHLIFLFTSYVIRHFMNLLSCLFKINYTLFFLDGIINKFAYNYYVLDSNRHDIQFKNKCYFKRENNKLGVMYIV